VTDLPGPTSRIPKAAYAGVMAPTCIVSAAAAGGMALALGGDRNTALLAVVSIAAASVVTFLPAMFATRSASGETNFGILVLVASVARMLGALTIALVFAQTQAVADVAFWFGILAGAGTLLLIESAAAISILARLDRRNSPTTITA
jgi:hypothetical protein